MDPLQGEISQEALVGALLQCDDLTLDLLFAIVAFISA